MIYSKTQLLPPQINQGLQSVAGTKNRINQRLPRETLIYSKTQLLPPDKSRPPERCRGEKSNKSAPP
ncbi:hypothetical protein F4W70_29845 [Pseudomonas cannabina]|nr:hypothetical protein F4W70_29845 [Pseudomonas cannabina]